MPPDLAGASSESNIVEGFAHVDVRLPLISILGGLGHDFVVNISKCCGHDVSLSSWFRRRRVTKVRPGHSVERTTRPASDADRTAIFTLHRAAFGGDAEARLVESLHESGDVRLSLVAEQDGEIVGHVLFSELSVMTPTEEEVAGLALAPLAVHPDWQRRGIGTELVRAALQQLRAEGWGLVLVLGEPDYYSRFDFTTAAARGLQSPYAGEYFLALDLQGETAAGTFLRGEVLYPAPFSDLA
jgi:putative acetyltransferase